MNQEWLALVTAPTRHDIGATGHSLPVLRLDADVVEELCDVLGGNALSGAIVTAIV